MTLTPSDVLDGAISDMVGAAAMVDVMQSYLDHNAKAAREVYGRSDDRRIHLLTANEARALDYVLNAVVCAAESLRAAHDAIA